MNCVNRLKKRDYPGSECDVLDVQGQNVHVYGTKARDDWNLKFPQPSCITCKFSTKAIDERGHSSGILINELNLIF